MANSLTENLFGITPKPFNELSSPSKKKELFGLQYPLHQNKNIGGYFTKITGRDLIIGAVRQLVRTEKGERVMLPDYGCSLKRFLFEPLEENIFVAIRKEILNQFNKYILGARLLSIKVLPGAKNSTSESNSIQVILKVQIRSEDLAVFDIPILLS